MVQVSEITDVRLESSRPAVVLALPLKRALERLLLCNRIRELADYRMTPVTVKDLRGIGGLLAFLVRVVDPSGIRARRSGAIQLLMDVWIIITLRLLLLFRRHRIGEDLRSTVGVLCRAVLFRHQRYAARPTTEMVPHVRCSEKEELLIRSCLLLRTMQRYGPCIEFLIQRLTSGLPAAETRRWLAFFLREIGDDTAADALLTMEPAASEATVIHHLEVPKPPAQHAPRRLKYGLYVMTVFDSDVFRSSLLSLMNSDYDGQIVVAEDGYLPNKVCEAFCREVGVPYIKNPEWTYTQPLANLAIQAFDEDTDILLQAPNDVLWPPRWFGQLDGAWKRVFDTGKVGGLTMSAVQFDASVEPMLKEAFVRGRYEGLLWVLKMRAQVHPWLDWYREALPHDGSQLFGLPKDLYTDDVTRLLWKVAHGGAVSTFSRTLWTEVNRVPSQMRANLDLELGYQCWTSRRWFLAVNNTPLIHMIGQDSRRLTGRDKVLKVRVKEMFKQDDALFRQKYGEDWYPPYWYFSGESCMIYHDEILRAVNEGRFDEIDFVFDDFEARRKGRYWACSLPSLSRSQ